MVRNKIKKIYSFLLVFIALGIGTIVYADTTEWSGGIGTINNPYLISNASDFTNFIDAIRDTTGTGENENLFAKAYYKQTADIDFSGLDSINGLNVNSTFTGIYDGQGFLIKNIVVNSPNGSLFGVLGTNGVIKNFGLDNAIINHSNDESNSGSFAGGLLRVLRGGTLENIYINANVNSTSTTVNFVSGIVAYIDGSGIINNAFYSGVLSARETAALYGIGQGSSCNHISNVYVPSSLLPFPNNGKFVNNISNVYNYTDDVIKSGEILNLLNNYAISTEVPLAKWISDGNGYPILSGTLWEIDDYSSYLSNGTGTIESPYIISNRNDFRFLLESINNGKTWENKYFSQTKDIDFANNSISTMNPKSEFLGIYDGAGHIVKDLNLSNTTYDYGALFGRLGTNGIIKNFGIHGGTLTTNKPNNSTLIAGLYGGSVINTYSTMNIISQSKQDKVSTGLVLSFYSGTIRNSYYGGTITYEFSSINDRKAGIASFVKNSNISSNLGILNTYWNNSIVDGYSIRDLSESVSKYTEYFNHSSSLAKNELGLIGVEKLNNYVTVNEKLNFWECDLLTGMPIFKSEVSDGHADITFLSGNGTKDSPYLINNLSDFRNFFNNLGELSTYTSNSLYKGIYFAQTTDIDFTGDSLIMLSLNQFFAGIYDGKGHSVNNIYITGSNGGLFGSIVDGGILKNFGLNGGIVEALPGNSIGTLARRLSGGSIINCYVTADIIGQSDRVGALVGYIDFTGDLKNSYFAGSVTATTDEIVGLARITNSTNVIIDNCSVIDTLDLLYKASSPNGFSISNTSKVSSDFIKTTLMEKLNNYVAQNSDSELYYWINDEDVGHPVYFGREFPIIGINSIAVNVCDNNLNSNNNCQISWYLDNFTGEYYLLLPKLANRDSLISYLDLMTSNSTITAYDINNNALGTLVNGVATDIFQNNKVILENTKKGYPTKQYIVNIKQSTISSIYINLEGGDATFNAINSDPNHEFEGIGTSLIADTLGNVITPNITSMKGRGNTTWKRTKKPYQLKFDSKISMLGMAPSKTWLLLSSYSDGSLSRSYLAYKFAMDFGIEYSTECTPADIYINGKYQGSYLVTSKVQQGSNRVEIDDSDYLLEIDNQTDDYQIKTSQGYIITVKNPDFSSFETDEEVTLALANVKKYLDDIEVKIYSSTSTYSELAEVLDLESFAKFYWVQEIFENYDAMVGSCYMYYQDGKLHMGPVWDMDNTLNRSYIYGNLESYYILDDTRDLSTRMQANWYIELMKKKDFSNLVDKIFLNNIELITSLKKKTSDYVEYISASADMNYVRWNYGVMKTEQSKSWIANENNFADATANLVSNMETRIDWYLEQYKDLILSSINYTTLDNKGNEVKGVIDLSSNTSITLPASVNKNATIFLEGVVENGTKVILNSIVLNDGTYSNKVAVTNTITLTANKESNNNYYDVSFVLAEPELKDIKIETNPTKLNYIEGQLFDKTGMVVMAILTDDSTRIITDYLIDKTTELATTDDTIIITYQGKMKSISINVIANAVTSICIATNPTKMEYIVGEVFDKTGMVVKATYLDGSVKEVTNYSISKESALLESDREIKVILGNNEVSLNITIVTNAIISIDVISMPKLTYFEGQFFDKTGMVVKATYANGLVSEIDDYKIDKNNSLSISDTMISISFNGFSTTLDIIVNKDYMTALNITKMPNKLTYIEGHRFDTTGMEVTATYASGITKKITNYTISNFNTLTTNDKVISINYSNFTASVNISVSSNTITSINVLEKPNKVIYNVGDVFEPNGMVVSATYLDGTTKIINNYVIDKINQLTIDDKYITIRYNDLTTTVDIEVMSKYIEYDVIDGKNQTYELDENKESELSIRIDADYTLLESVYLNGVKVDSKYYSVIEGSTIIKFTKDYLSTLNEGIYEVVVTFTDGGKAHTNITITNVSSSNNNIIVYVVISILFVISIIVGYIVIYKRKYNS